MIGVGMAIVWIFVVGLAFVACAVVERRVRLTNLRRSHRWPSARAEWGFDADRPPVVSLFARALAGFARLVRSGTRISDQSATLPMVGRLTSCLALISGLAMIPFAGTWGGGAQDPALVAVDARHGLIALVFLLSLAAFAHVGVGLAERSPWSRVGAVELASQSLGGLVLLVLVLAPLALAPASFRLQDVVSVQQTTIHPFGWLPASWVGEAFDFVRVLPWPRWNLFLQPLTAVLFIPALHFLIRRPSAQDVMTSSVRAVGFGLDATPSDLYWHRLEARLADAFAAALFVALFLGAGAIPFLSLFEVVAVLEGYVGFQLPALLAVAVGISVFFAKLVVVLLLGGAIRLSMAQLRSDQTMRLIGLRLIPLAWANLLLMAAITLVSADASGTSLASFLGTAK